MRPEAQVPATEALDQAWTAYAAHRAKEATLPSLADDPAHVAEAYRLHSAFMAIFDEREADDVVVAFRRRG